jgi:PAS domain S-box-containing protein
MEPDSLRMGRQQAPQTPDAAGDGRLFRDVVEGAPYAMLLVLSDGRMVLVNAEAERLFDYQRDELIGQQVEMLLPERLRHAHVALRGGFMIAPQSRPMGAGRDLFGRRRDGSEIPMEVGLRPVQTADGPGVLAAITDISIRKQENAALAAANEALRRANAEITRKNAEINRKNEEVESFVYIVSHDLRAPLVNLQGFSRELELSCAELEAAMARAGAPATDVQALQVVIRDDIGSTLHFIRTSVAKLDRLISALLRLSRTGEQQLRSDRLDVGAIVGTTLDILRRAAEHAGAQITLSPLPEARGDATAVGQVFANLIENALKYAAPDRPPEIEIGGISTDGMSQYWIRDNGLGIPTEVRPRLFQIFQRFHPERAAGDGVGLAAVKRIVERLGGTVWAEDAAPAGTVFRFTLPATARTNMPC